MPRNICETHDHAYVARLRCNGQGHYRLFSYARDGDPVRALAEAQAWVEQMRRALGLERNARRRSYFKACLANKSTPERVGVHRRIRPDTLYPQLRYVCFYVNWSKVPGKPLLKGFQAGPVATLTEADERHTYLTAVAFREHWEHCRDTGAPFDPALYKAWRTVTCYPFVASR
jgi:hypothetical protein